MALDIDLHECDRVGVRDRRHHRAACFRPEGRPRIVRAGIGEVLVHARSDRPLTNSAVPFASSGDLKQGRRLSARAMRMSA